jgi:hypothetical protein
MHEDVQVLEIVCSYYRATYASDALRRERNKLRRLRRTLAKVRVELGYLRSVLTAWQRAYMRLVSLAGIL